MQIFSPTLQNLDACRTAVPCALPAGQRMHADLVKLGYDGSYERVAAFARAWRDDRHRAEQTTGRGTFVPLLFEPGRVSTSMTTGFVLDALNQAICQRHPEKGLIHHSDRGSQYLSIRHTERLADADIDTSVGSVGDSYDIALAETIIGLFKAEVIELLGPWKNMSHVEWETLQWVDWYNNERLLSSIGNRPPNEKEHEFYETLNQIEKAAKNPNKIPSGKPGAVQFSARFLIIAMILSPMRLLLPNSGFWRCLMRRRRYFGVAAFAYAAFHTFLYLVDMGDLPFYHEQTHDAVSSPRRAGTRLDPAPCRIGRNLHRPRFGASPQRPFRPREMMEVRTRHHTYAGRHRPRLGICVCAIVVAPAAPLSCQSHLPGAGGQTDGACHRAGWCRVTRRVIQQILKVVCRNVL